MREVTPRLVVGALMLVAFVASAGCKRKVSRSQCDELIDRYAMLVAREKYPDGPSAAVWEERERERVASQGHEYFKRCPTEVTDEVYACAMKAANADGVLRCVE